MGKKKLLPLQPTEFQCGPYRWSVDWTVEGWGSIANSSARFDQDKALYYGFTDPAQLQLWINPHAAEQFQREALLHEVTHAAQFVAGLPNEGQIQGEEFVTRVTPVLLDTLMRNPGLREYLFWED